MEEVDRTLLTSDSGVESALLYAKAWSKYAKDLLSWVEKRLNLGELSSDSALLWPHSATDQQNSTGFILHIKSRDLTNFFRYFLLDI